MELTEAEVKELWELCGLHEHMLENVDYTTEMPFWRCSICGKRFYTECFYGKETVPNPLNADIDLNNLFKYAVPRLDGFPIIKIKSLSYGQWQCRINAGDYYVSDTPELALFRAIFSVLKEANNVAT